MCIYIYIYVYIPKPKPTLSHNPACEFQASGPGDCGTPSGRCWCGVPSSPCAHLELTFFEALTNHNRRLELSKQISWPHSGSSSALARCPVSGEAGSLLTRFDPPESVSSRPRQGNHCEAYFDYPCRCIPASPSSQCCGTRELVI